MTTAKASRDAGTTALMVIGIVFGLLAQLILAHIFGITAIVCGAIAGARGRVAGWFAVALGVLAIVLWAIQVAALFSEGPG